MAKPTGAIETNELGYLVTKGDAGEHLYIGHRLPQEIRYWSEQGYPYMKLRYRSCVSVDAGDTLYIQYHNGVTETRAGPLVYSWSAAWIELTQNIMQNNENSTRPEGNPHELIEDYDLFGHVRPLLLWTDKGDTSCILHSVAVEAWLAVDYDDAPAGPPLDHVERIDRGGGADVVYRKYGTLSAWHGMQILSASVNRCGYQNRLSFSIPFFSEKPVS